MCRVSCVSCLAADTNTVSLSFLYLLFPALALGQWRRCANTLRHYLMPLYFYKHDRARATRQLSLLWLLAPQLALARWTASNTETRARITGLWHYVRNQRYCSALANPIARLIDEVLSI